jgi:uncharacterized protein
MLLDLRTFRGGTEDVVRRYKPEAFNQADGDYRVVAPAVLELKVTKDAQKVRLTGRLTTTLEVDCSRCLEPFQVPVDAPIDLMFLPATGDGATQVAGEQEMSDADAGVSFYKDDTIDLGDLMRDEFYLALPMKPLCKPDCRGLCPECGINRNRETCACKVEWIDPRLESLRTLLKHDD